MAFRTTLAAVAVVTGLAGVAAGLPAASAADYVIDTKGAHASINFRIKHLGYSWLVGRFDTFQGRFSFDPDKPEASNVKVTIATASLNTNHAERDKHLRSADFLNVEAHPEAVFESTGVEVTGDGTAVIRGNLTLNGVTKPVDIDVEYIGGGADPWGGHRQGFNGATTLTLADFGITYNLGPDAREVQLDLNVEGVRQ